MMLESSFRRERHASAYILFIKGAFSSNHCVKQPQKSRINVHGTYSKIKLW